MSWRESQMPINMEEEDSDIPVQSRPMETVNAILEYAKLERSELKPLVQNIFFSPELDNDHMTLMELDSHMLDVILEGNELVIRGDKDEMAVLCTNEKTYEVKEAEISNDLLITPEVLIGKDLDSEGDPCQTFSQVLSVLHTYYELRECKPRIHKLKSLLEENHYSGRESERDEKHQGRKFQFEDFLEIVQASETEIRAGLRQLQACQIEGFWRLLDFDYLCQVLNHIIQLCEENDWLEAGIPLAECLLPLEELFPRSVIEHTLECYSRTRQEVMQSFEGSERYNLDEDKICRFFAELTLKNSDKFNYKEFLNVWQQCVPDGMTTSLYQIEGMCLIDKIGGIEVIWYYPVEELPEEVADRFEALFKTREKWTREEIIPYIKDLATDKTDVGALLTKYARASMSNGIKMFNSRKTTR
ncbi:hypothetical protein ScPMuIL_017161 [Solemya velum]